MSITPLHATVREVKDPIYFVTEFNVSTFFIFFFHRINVQNVPETADCRLRFTILLIDWLQSIVSWETGVEEAPCENLPGCTHTHKQVRAR